jgi:hypothetical protein
METAPEERNALLELLRARPRSRTELLKASGARRQARLAALEELLAQGDVVKLQSRYFLDEPRGSIQRLIEAEAARLEEYLHSLPELVARSGMKIRRGVQDPALVGVALERLLNMGRVVQLRYNDEKLCIHIAHLHLAQQAAGKEGPGDVPAQEESLSYPVIYEAYERVRARQLGSAVFISDLATELKLPVTKLQEWIRQEVIASGRGSLDEGHWPAATEAQREAAVEHLGTKRLLIRF